MAQILKLNDSLNDIDLLAGNLVLEEAGLSISSGKNLIWQPISLVSGASDNAVRSTKRSIDEYIEKALRYRNNPSEKNPVWLYWQSDNEIAKRCVIFDGESELISRAPFNTPLLGREGAIINMVLQRHPFWESESPESTMATGNISAFGGGATLVAIDGTTEGRIQKTRITSATTPDLSQFWVGLQPNRNGVANLVPVWEAEDMTPNDPGEVSTVVDASASGGEYVAIDFTQGTGMLPRLATVMSNHVLNTNHYIQHVGRWLVLLRCRVNASTTQALVRMRAGWGPATKASTVTTQILDGQTSFRLVEFGEIQIPPAGYRDSVLASSELGFYQMVFDAERLSASGSLHVDAVCLIPSEHMIAIDTSPTEIDSTGGTKLDVYTTAAWPFIPDSQYAHAISSGDLIVYAVTPPTFRDWHYPTIGGRIIAAAQPAIGAHDINATLNLSQIIVYPRWKSYAYAP